jgi:hypothetical protein
VGRMARAMPPGNLITLIFLAAFRLAGHRIGLGWGVACGYASALATLLALEALVRSSATDSHPGARTTLGPGAIATKGAVAPAVTPTILDRRSGGPGPIARRRHRRGRRFAPRIEVIPERGLLDPTTGAIMAIGPTLRGPTLVKLVGLGFAANGQLYGPDLVVPLADGLPRRDEGGRDRPGDHAVDLVVGWRSWHPGDFDPNHMEYPTLL